MAVLYLGIDRVLLRGNSALGWELAPHAGEFLRGAIAGHTPFWLAPRAHAEVVAAFRDCAELEPLALAIAPLAWNGAKIAAIDMDADFYWIDANPMPEDHQALDHRARWVEVNTDIFPDALLAAMTMVDVLEGR